MHQVLPRLVLPIPWKRGSLAWHTSLTRGCVICGPGTEMRPLINSPGYYVCAKCDVWYKSHGDRGLGVGFEVAWHNRKNDWHLLGEMETSHIQHIIALMIVKPNWRERYRRIMLDEYERRRLSEEDNGTPT